MAEYINIKGQNIEVVASDPANPTLGQIWYNSTSNTLKGGDVTTAGAWATGNNMNTARIALAGAGTQTATLAGTGESPRVSTFASFNGSTWASEANYPTNLQGSAGSGVESAGIVAGGTGATPAVLADCNTYDGTAWTATGSLATAKALHSTIGNISGAKSLSGNTTTTGVEDYTGPGAPVTKTITAS